MSGKVIQPWIAMFKWLWKALDMELHSFERNNLHRRQSTGLSSRSFLIIPCLRASFVWRKMRTRPALSSRCNQSGFVDDGRTEGKPTTWGIDQSSTHRLAPKYWLHAIDDMKYQSRLTWWGFTLDFIHSNSNRIYNIKSLHIVFLSLSPSVYIKIFK